MRRFAVAILLFFPYSIDHAMASGTADPDLKIIGTTHTTATYNSLSGPGSRVKNLANSYDMTLFEYGLGGKQASFNGSGITTNTNYPLTDGEALTNNTQIGLSKQLSGQWNAGALAEIYSLIGNQAVGRTYGQELPWDNFPRENGAVVPYHFNADLYNAFLEGNHESIKLKVVGGSLSPKELPEFTRKEMNQVKLGSLVYRAPITNESYFEKSDWKLEEGRHPLRGIDVIADHEYIQDRHLHAELFTGATEPTPIADIERESYGGRISADIEHGNVGFTGLLSDGLRPVTGHRERESIWSIDSSYKLMPGLVPYFTFSQTDYDREDTGESHSGEAYVAGLWLKFPNTWELKSQFQRVGENYDLMAGHKIEHYPSNFQGLNAQGTIPLSASIQLKGLVYYLEQIKTQTTTEDTLFGDSYFSSSIGSDRGTIGAERISIEVKLNPSLKLNGTIEHAKFRKNTLTSAQSIDKDVYNFYGHLSAEVAPKLYLEAGFRHFFSVGNWQTMNFRSAQDIPEAAIHYQFGKESADRIYLIYHFIGFTDSNDASLGLNDYQGHQVFAEFKIAL